MTFHASFPKARPRRMRVDDSTRRLRQEHTVSVNDLIQPIFVKQGLNDKENIASMPGIFRHSMDSMLAYCDEIAALNIPALALFPVIADDLKTADGRESANPKGMTAEAIRSIKKKFPQLLVIADIALDPFTTHGQDGIVDAQGYVKNDDTNAALVKQALNYAAAGADIVAPSDMMDGRIGIIRNGLEENGFTNTKILSYAAKYASAFYGPFRDAVGSSKALGKSDKKNYQMDPANVNEALWEAGMDISEGADMIMVKPGLPYLDVIRVLKDEFRFPTFAYHVSGEYAMIKAAAQQGWIDERAVVLETLLAFKRAGCDGILTYYAREAAQWLATPKV